MNKNVITIVSVSLAVIVAGAAAITVSIKRAETARHLAEVAASEEAKSENLLKKAREVTAAENAKAREAEANKQARADELEASKAAQAKAEADRNAAEENRKAKEAEAKIAADRLAEAKALQETKTADAKRARAEREAAQAAKETAKAKEKTAADLLAAEKLKSDKIIAEAKLKELRKIDFETLARDLAEWKQDLEERERALTPEKTISDLSWAGGNEDTIFDADGNVKKQVKVEYNPENDPKLPSASRRLARIERLCREANALAGDQMRKRIISELECLYEAAIREDRPVDADFYHKTLKGLYPDWEYKAK